MNKIRIKTKIGLCITLLLICSFGFQAFAKTYSAEVDDEKQDKGNWCWAACGEAIMDYHGEKTNQKEFYESVYGDTDYDDVMADAQKIRKGFKDYGYSSKYKDRVLSESYTEKEIKADRPFIAHLTSKWFNKNKSHFVVIDGYENKYDFVEYMDPARGWHVSKSYDDLTEFEDDDEQCWRYTIYKIED